MVEPPKPSRWCQSSRALGYPTILQAMTGHVHSMKERNRVSRLGEWRVKQVEGICTRYEFSYEIKGQRANGSSGSSFGMPILRQRKSMPRRLLLMG